MNTPTVYLCGPISFLEYEEANDWREYATGYLESFGIKARSPLRGKDFLKEMGVIGISEYDDHPLATDRGIIARDRFDVRTSDLMLANLLGADKSSIGSPAEFAWADAFGTPVVTAMEKSQGRAVVDPQWRAWLAALVDGEGCIQIAKRTETKNVGYRVSLNIVNTNKEILEKAQGVSGGLGSIRLKRENVENRKAVWIWNCATQQASQVLIDIYQYLIIKKQQAALAIQMAKVTAANRPNGGKKKLASQITLEATIFNKFKMVMLGQTVGTEEPPCSSGSSPYDHPFIRGLSGYRVTTLDEALTICRIILL